MSVNNPTIVSIDGHRHDSHQDASLIKGVSGFIWNYYKDWI